MFQWTEILLQGFKGQSSNNTDLLGMAYAVAYPGGIVGIILTMLLIRNVFRINPEAEAIAYAAVYPLAMILMVFVVQILILTVP